MALSFTTIPDRHGPAVYLIGNGSSRTETQLQKLGEQIDSATNDNTTVVYLDPRQGDGLRVKEFYALRRLPCVMIVMDDDSVPYQWNTTLPRAEEVTYTLSQIGGSMRVS